MRSRTALISGLAVAMAVASCSGSAPTADAPDLDDGLRVASFDFAESEILAELYANAAEDAGVPVVRLGAIGPREIVVPAMRDDLVDLVPEYVGSALGFAGATDVPTDAGEAAAALDRLVDEFGIDVLEPAAAVDVNVFVVSDVVAERLDLSTVSDLADAGLTRFGGPPECPDRPFCLVGLRDMYGVSFDEFVAQPSLSFTAEALRRDEIDVGVLFSSSHELDAPDLVVLDDDRRLQPPENVVPMVRRDALERWPVELEAALDAVSARLTTLDLRRMNGQVADGEPAATVARDWLESLG